MCGIVGYLGDKNGVNIVVDGLKKLEYRGYDSAGLAIINKDKIKENKNTIKIEIIERIIIILKILSVFLFSFIAKFKS